MQDTVKNRPVLGIIEQVSLPDLGVFDVQAKIDTGAYSGALHCESIEVAEREDGKRVLRIQPIDTSKPIVEVESFRKLSARSASGHQEVRYVIDTPIIVRNKTYTITIGVTKRDMMNMKVLVGRRFLRRNHMIVDVLINQELDDDGGRKI